MANTKITQKMALDYIIENCELPTEYAEKVKAMRLALDKKSDAPRNPSPTVIENKGLRESILKTMEPNTLYSINDLIRKVPGLENSSSHKVSALLTPLKREGLILRVEDKRKAYFKLA